YGGPELLPAALLCQELETDVSRDCQQPGSKGGAARGAVLITIQVVEGMDESVHGEVVLVHRRVAVTPLKVAAAAGDHLWLVARPQLAEGGAVAAFGPLDEFVIGEAHRLRPSVSRPVRQTTQRILPCRGSSLLYRRNTRQITCPSLHSLPSSFSPS